VVNSWGAARDTGYPDLQLPAVPPAEQIRDRTELPHLADLLLEAIGLSTPKRRLPISQYLDHIRHNAFDPLPPASIPQQVSGLLYET